MKTIETAVILPNSPELPELSELLQIAALYEQYLKDDEMSETFRKAVSAAKQISQSGSEVQINKAAEYLFQTILIFHDDTFMPEKTKTKNAGLIKTLNINGARCAYEAQTKTFYFPVGISPEIVFSFDFSITSEFDMPSLNIKLAVFAEIIDFDGYVFPHRFTPELNKEYILRAYSENFTFDYKIMFTMLPIVQISAVNMIHDDYDDCFISMTDPDFTFSPFNTSMLYYAGTAQIHIRGSSARQYPKKSYAVKFTDENKNDKAVSFFGIDGDSHWILDAMYNDMARMRNRVSTDLWLEFSSPLYYESVTSKPVYNGTQGGFVELFINDEYMGLYCLTTKINRNQLQLKNYDAENNIMHGVSYKGKSWDEALRFKSYHDYNNAVNWWAGFEQKYPNPENGLPVDWEPLYDFIRFVVDSDDETFRSKIGGMIDINNFVDYTIFLCFSYAHDNTGKNLYFSVYDVQDTELSKFFITVWDVKSTWGRSWRPVPTKPDLEWMDSDPGHDTEIFRRLILTNADSFADKLRTRWEEVKVGAFSPEAVKARFIQYFELFEVSGAFEREEKRWRMGLDLAAEREYILNWIDARYVYINDFIMNKLDTVGDFAPQKNIS